MAMCWYSCGKCGNAVCKDSSPNLAGCTSSNGYHSWHNLGRVGRDNYSCSNCGLVVQTDSSPNLAGCTSSNGYHSWHKL